MPSRRDLIRMTDDELHAFLDEQRIVQVTTLGPTGRPHLMPLWYVPDGETLLGWTFAKSQKAKNLERDPHVTLTVQNSENPYEYVEIRGQVAERTREGADEHTSETLRRLGHD